MCERVSSVDPDFDETRKSVFARSSFRSRARMAFGCVVSRTWKVSAPKVRRSTSGARLEPPMPARTTLVRPSSYTRRANASSSSMRSCMRRGSSSQPSQRFSSAPVQSVASRFQTRSTSSEVPICIRPRRAPDSTVGCPRGARRRSRRTFRRLPAPGSRRRRRSRPPPWPGRRAVCEPRRGRA